MELQPLGRKRRRQEKKQMQSLKTVFLPWFLDFSDFDAFAVCCSGHSVLTLLEWGFSDVRLMCERVGRYKKRLPRPFIWPSQPFNGPK